MTIYVLVLSDMRSPKIEYSNAMAAWSTSREALQRLFDEETVEPYRDSDGDNPTRWYKAFRKGGPLEWFNHEPFMLDDKIQTLPSEEEALAAFRAQREQTLSRIPEVLP